VPAARPQEEPDHGNQSHYVLIGAFTLIIGFGLLPSGCGPPSIPPTAPGRTTGGLPEAVTGLSVGSPVQYNGIAVGSITKLSLAPDDPRQVIADVRIESNTPIKTDTRAKLGITSLTGPTVIQLSGGTPGHANCARWTITTSR
jgi:phospholipid/cholesterol/gamma-HCH transport system substrate-binding protein